jgi:Protein kinase domain
VICGNCGRSLTRELDPCPSCTHSPILNERYRLDEVVGQGASGITYRATRIEDGHIVAVKELPFHRIDSFKVQELFEREARVLRQISHPGIPAYLDDFTAGAGKSFSFYLVQDFILGRSLALEFEDRRYSEVDVREVLVELLGILGYLHDLEPPIIHRDVKPSNVMRRKDGTLALIDFGSVRDAIEDPVKGGSTIAGTFGFMAPEQFQGRARPATDLYGLGVLALVLLTREKPEAMMNASNALEWQDRVDVSVGLRRLLQGMLEPDLERRFNDAHKLAERLRAIEEGKSETRWQAAPELAPPKPDKGARGVSTVQTHRNSQNTWLKWAGLAVAGILAVVVPLAMRAESQGMPNVRMCGDKPCAPVPRGLKGLQFGFSYDQATQALPEVAKGTEMAPETFRSMSGILSPGMIFTDPIVIPGRRVRMKTTIGAFSAVCDLSFAVKETLSKMRCTLDDRGDRAAHIAAEKTLLEHLTQTHGPSSIDSSPKKSVYGTDDDRNGSWTWRDEHAELVLTTTFKSHDRLEDFKWKSKSELVLENTSKEHKQLLSRLEAEDQERRSQREAAKRREEQDRLRREREKIEAGVGALESDLK